MKKSQVKIAIIDNSIDPSIYMPVKHWSTYLDEEWYDFRAKNGMFPDLNHGYTHIRITGSEASIIEREKWVEQEITLIKEAILRGLSILGSCYGHQLLALALAGPGSVRRSPHPEVGWIPLEIKSNKGILGDNNTAYMFSIHFDEVINLNDDFSIIAASEFCDVHAFQYQDKPIWGIQAHPEINIGAAKFFLKKLIEQGSYLKPLFEKVLNSSPKDSRHIFTIMKEFLK
jgi:GMP synthase-like glutamine amidotransferase